ELAKQKIATWTAPTDGDVVTSAKALADQLIADKVDVAIIDANQSDPIAALIAAWETAPVKINLARQAPLFSRNVSCVTYLDPARFETDRTYWQQYGIESKFILEG